MFQDEARFGRISDTRYCWARRPMRAMVKVMQKHIWDGLREKYFHNRAFDSLDALKDCNT